MKKYLIIIALFLSTNFYAESTFSHFHLQNFDSVIISTDLEPDDVLALKIIFQEANRLFAQQPSTKYPIDLIIVGEGNTTIKKMRMEKLLRDLLDIPLGISIPVVEGRSANDNLFPYDGEEFFEKDILAEIPYKDNDGSDAEQMLAEVIQRSPAPLIIQLKPVQELLFLASNSDLARKASVLFYGSFNFRKTLKDPLVQQNALFQKDNNLMHVNMLQILLNHFGQQFLKIGIIESYGVLGDQTAVYEGFPWSAGIAHKIENSSDPFLTSFIQLTHNWNAYLFQEVLFDIAQDLQHIEDLPESLTAHHANLYRNIQELLKEWSEETFASAFGTAICFIQEAREQQFLPFAMDNLERSIYFAQKLRPSSRVQFTLADVIAALAVRENYDLLSYRPVSIHINPKGFIETQDDKDSSIFYYNRVEREPFARFLEEIL